MILIDVVIPVRDIVQYLPTAIESALNQRGVSPLVTVVDAGSKVPVSLSREHASCPNVQLVRCDNPLTIGSARNLGVTSTTRDNSHFLMQTTSGRLNEVSVCLELWSLGDVGWSLGP